MVGAPESYWTHDGDMVVTVIDGGHRLAAYRELAHHRLRPGPFGAFFSTEFDLTRAVWSVVESAGTFAANAIPNWKRPPKTRQKFASRIGLVKIYLPPTAQRVPLRI